MSLDVIGAGFGRTGTLSLKLALEHLGFAPCYHMAETSTYPEHDQKWLALAHDTTGEVSAVLNGYRATVDWPGVFFWKRLIAENPNAKVILTLRDPKAWHRSASNTIFARMERFAEALANEEMTHLTPARRTHKMMVNAIIREQTFGGDFSRDHAMRIFNEHNEEVRRTVPSKTLLVYEAGQGWEPLCAFLGREVPDTPYPSVNSTAKFDEAFPDTA